MIVSLPEEALSGSFLKYIKAKQLSIEQHLIQTLNIKNEYQWALSTEHGYLSGLSLTDFFNLGSQVGSCVWFGQGAHAVTHLVELLGVA
jgi:hypothetical protein